jgi:PAS domain S-box-containing protein
MIISLYNFIALTCFVAAAGIILRQPRERNSLKIIPIAMLVYAFLCFSNILEHSLSITSFDSLEDAGEMIFVLLFLFFVFSFRSETTTSEIRQREEWLRFTFAAIGDGIVITDAGGQIKQINKAMSAMTGVAEEECIGKPASQIVKLCNQISGEPVTFDPFTRSIEEKKIIKLPDHTVVLKGDTRTILLAYNVIPIIGDNHKAIGAAMVIRDIEREVDLQRQLVHAQKMDAIGQLAGGIAHDFNNLLGGISGACELLQMKLNTDNDSAELIEIIQKASTRAADLTSKLLTFSRKGNLVFQTVDLHKIVKDSISLLERSIDKRISIKTKFLPEPAIIRCDPSQLESAIINLGVNARDAMPEGGSISISTETVFLDREWCNTTAPNLKSGNYVMLSIQDSGNGISPEIQTKIFEPFFTTKEFGKGTGLGLASVYGTVDSHKGLITFYTEIGHGTVFHIYLPLESAAEAAFAGTVIKPCQPVPAAFSWLMTMKTSVLPPDRF